MWTCHPKFRCNLKVHTDDSHKLRQNKLRFSFPDSRKHRSSGFRSLLLPYWHSLRRVAQALSIQSLLLPQKEFFSPCPESSGCKYHTYAFRLNQGTSCAAQHMHAFYPSFYSRCRSDCNRHLEKHCFHPLRLLRKKHTFLLLHGNSAVWYCHCKDWQVCLSTACKSDTSFQTHLFWHVCPQTVRTEYNVHV